VNHKEDKLITALETRGSGEEKSERGWGMVTSKGPRKAFSPREPIQRSEQILERHLFHNISVCDHLGELLKTEFTIPVLVGFYNSFVHDLL